MPDLIVIRVDTRPDRAAAGLISGVIACAILLAVPDIASSRMLAWPWQLLYWLGPLCAGGALFYALVSHNLPRLKPSWRFALAIGSTGLTLSTAVSPYRDQILPWCVWPLTTLILAAAGGLLFSCPQNGPQRIRHTLTGLGLAGAFLAISSLSLWFMQLAPDWAAVLNSRNTHPLGHANYTAGTGVIFLPLLIGLAWSSRGIKRAAWSVAGLLCLLMLLSGGSRGALLALAGLGGLSMLAAWRHMPKIPLIAAVIILIGAGLLNPGVRRGLLPAPPDASVNMSNAQRTTWIKGGMKAIADRPISGWGTGATPWFLPRYRGDLDYGPYSILQLHNTPLQLWAEGGVLTFFGALALAGLTGWAAIRCLKESRSKSARPPFWAATASLTGYAIFAVTDWQLDLPIIATVLGLGLAIVIATAGTESAAQMRRRNRIAAQAAVGVFLLIVIGNATRQLPLRAALERDDWRSALRIAPQDAALRIYAADRLLHKENSQPEGTPASRRNEALALLKTNATENLIPELTHCLNGWTLLPTDSQAAIHEFTETLAVAPNHHAALLGLALASLDEQREPETIAALSRASIARPAFLASGWWRLPALAKLRPAVLAQVWNDLADVSSNNAVRPSVRSQAEYLRAMLQWLEGDDAAAAGLIAYAPMNAQKVFWRGLTQTASTDSTSALPENLQVVLRLKQDQSDTGWSALLSGNLGDGIRLEKERAVVSAHTATELVRIALRPTPASPFPYYQRRGERAGFQVNHRHPRLQGINDGSVHSENAWAGILLRPLWPDEFWLPDSLLISAAPLLGK